MHYYLKLCLAAGLSITGAASIAAEWPTSTVTMVVPFSPGGSNDTIARFIAQELSEHTGETVVVENRPGAGTAVGASYVARSEPDGNTILFVSSSVITNAAFEGDNLPYDPVNDITPVSMIARGNMAILGGSHLKENTLGEVAEAAAENPLFYGTFGVGSSGHVGGALIANALGVQLDPVHYPGGSEALLDLTAGRVDLVVGTVPGLMSTVESGGGKPLAVLGEERDPALPDTPTVVEAGYPDALYYSWYGTFVAAGTPDDIVAEINKAVNAVVASPAGTEFLANYKTTPVNLTPAEFADDFTSDLARWTRLVDEMGLASN